MVLQVGIIGAGIAGLAAAIAQRKAGNNVEIFEQSTFKNEVGAAISMTPNGTRILDSWGFNHQQARAVESQILEYIDGQTLTTHQKEDLSICRKDFGHSFNHYHRVDLHSELKDIALDPDGDGPTPILHLGQKVEDIDCELGLITLVSDNGETTTTSKKDLIIIADGIWSRFPSIVTQTDKTLSRSPMSAFRALVPMEDVLADEDLRRIFEGKPPGFWIPEFKRNHVVTYPCRNNTLLNMAVLHETLPDDEHKIDWHSSATTEEVLTVVKDFHPLVVKLVAKAKSFAVYKIMRRDLVETLVRGRAVLIGDAAHWMFPTHAQGAVTGIEEAAVIALLTQDIPCEDVAQRLGLHNELTLDRVHVTQILSNFGPRELAEQKSRRPLFPAGSGRYSESVRQYFYSFDAVKEAREYLQQQQQQQEQEKEKQTNGTRS